LPHSLVDLMETKPANFKDGFKKTLTLDSNAIEEIYAPTINAVEELVQKQIDSHAAKGKKFDYIFLVGGFAESKLLQTSIEKRFGSIVKQTKEPIRSVISGGVILGRKPELIRYDI